MPLEASSPALGSETKLPLRAVIGRPPIWSPAPCQRPLCVDHLSALVEQTGALGVLCFPIQWCQTLHLPSEAQHDPQGPPSHCPLHEPSLFLGSPPPQLTPALHRTSLTEGERGGRVDVRHGGGRLPWQSLKGFWGPGLGPRRKVLVCVCVCVCARECEGVCVHACTSSPGPPYPL